MLNRKIHILVLLACSLLCACSNAETTDMPATEPIQLTLTFGAGTYGVSPDPAEKEVKSIAIFVQTAKGEYLKYLSGAGDLSTPLAGTSGVYTTSIEVAAADYSGTSQVWAVANYVENGLETALLATESIADLKAVKTPALNAATDKPLCPLVQYGGVGINLLNTGKVSMRLKRMVARIDVVSESPSFDLIEALLYDVKSHGYVVAGNTQAAIASIGQLSRFASVQASDAKNIKGIYCFETSGTESTTPTLVVVGKHNGVDKVFNLELKTSGGSALIKPNSIYEVKVKNGSGNDLVIEFPDSDWENGD